MRVIFFMEQNQFPTNNSADGVVSHVPPPPSEVTARTLTSDIASIAESGGGSPKPRPVKVFRKEEHIQTQGGQRANVLDPDFTALRPPRKSFLSNPIFLISLLGVFLAGVFLIGYYILYPFLNPLPPQQTPLVHAKPPKTQEHKSFFANSSRPIDGTFVMDVSSTIDGLQADREMLVSKIGSLSGSFFEFAIQNGGGAPVLASNFFPLINGEILNKDFLANDFENDFTFFIYKENGKLWPGYIFQIKSGLTPILLKGIVSKLENASSSWNSLFLEQNGIPGRQFSDGLLNSGEPIRYMNFSITPSSLVYGWASNKYLIIATSIEAINQAALRL